MCAPSERPGEGRGIRGSQVVWAKSGHRSLSACRIGPDLTCQNARVIGRKAGLRTGRWGCAGSGSGGGRASKDGHAPRRLGPHTAGADAKVPQTGTRGTPPWWKTGGSTAQTMTVGGEGQEMESTSPKRPSWRPGSTTDGRVSGTSNRDPPRWAVSAQQAKSNFAPHRGSVERGRMDGLWAHRGRRESIEHRACPSGSGRADIRLRLAPWTEHGAGVRGIRSALQKEAASRLMP